MLNFPTLTLSYEDGKPILKDIHFKVKSGRKNCLSRTNGSGKTTIINLLSRFYDIDAGEIKIDGQNIMRL